MSLRLRLFLSHAIVMVIGVVVLALALLVLLRQTESRRTQRQLGTAAAAVTRIGRLIQANDTQQRLIDRLTRLAQDQRARVLLLDGTGVSIFDSAQNNKASMVGEPLSLDTTIETGNATPENSAVGEFRDGQGRRFTFAAVRTPANVRDRAAWLALALPVSNGLFAGLLDDISVPVLQALSIALVVAAGAAVFVARSIATPVQSVAAGAKALAAGDYSQRVPVAGPAEVRQLAADFNDMAAQVQGARQTERDFVANVSHELKTPLTSIQGFAQAIHDGTVADVEGTQQAARIIYEEADRLRRLVGGLLDSARIESGELRMAFGAVHLNDIAQVSVMRMQPRADAAGIGLSHTLAPNLPPVTADGDRLAQVLTNLIDNSLKHTPAGGKVTVESKWVTRKSDGARLVEISVADTGGGIPPEDLPHVFERFYQADKSRSHSATGSAGLGLSICKQIAEAHGGQILAQSVMGLGTRMTVWLPVGAVGASFTDAPA